MLTRPIQLTIIKARVDNIFYIVCTPSFPCSCITCYPLAFIYEKHIVLPLYGRLHLPLSTTFKTEKSRCQQTVTTPINSEPVIWWLILLYWVKCSCSRVTSKPHATDGASLNIWPLLPNGRRLIRASRGVVHRNFLTFPIIPSEHDWWWHDWLSVCLPSWPLLAHWMTAVFLKAGLVWSHSFLWGSGWYLQTALF